jgi:GT2 family glycosyltransferase
MKKNQGPNPARNRLIKETHSELVFIMDNDIVLSPDVITLLEEALYQNPDGGVAGVQIRLYDQPERVQYNGCHIHFVGGAILNKLNLDEPVVVGAVSAGAMLIDCHKAQKIGLFDEDFIFGWEDGDFTFRMTIAGYPCLVVSKAQVFHKTEKKGIRWIKYQVRNRWWFMLKNYHFRTIVVILPVFLLYQLSIFSFFILKGQFIPFVQGTISVLTSLPQVIRKRREVMKFKKIRDKQVLSGKSIDLLGDADSSFVVRLSTKGLNFIFSLYWFFAKRFVK